MMILMLAILLAPLVLEHGPLLEEKPDTVFIQYLNKSRGAKPLVLDAKLCAQAQTHAEMMAKHKRFEHSFLFVQTGHLPQGSSPKGENVARGQRSGYKLYSDWMGSLGHRNTMLNASYGRMGLGYAQASDGVWYWSLQLEP